MLTSKVRTSPNWVEELRSEWQELVDDAPDATIFQTWEWQSSWWKHYRGASRPFILEFYEGDDLVGLMPMARTSFPWRALTPMGHGKSDYLPPLCRPEHREAVGSKLAEFLTESRNFDFAQLTAIPEDEPVLRHVDPATIGREYPCLLLDLDPDFGNYFKTLGESLRRYLHRFERDCVQKGTHRVERWSGERVPEGLDALFALHSKRWEQRGQPGGFAFARIRDLYRSWATLADARGWLRLHVLLEGERPVGVLLGAVRGGTYAYHNIGFDPDAAEIRPGWVLIADSIRCATEEGCRRYDFLLGAEEYKTRWKPQILRTNCRITLTRPGIRGRLGRAWYETGRTRLIIARRRVRTLASRLRGGGH